MAEAMTVETIIEAYWELQNYWTKLRVPIKTQKGGWTDIDVVAYNPSKKELVIAESKVRGKKTDVKVYAEEFHNSKEGGDFFAYDKSYGVKGKYDYLSLIDKLDDTEFMDSIFTKLSLDKDDVKTISFQLVSNYYIEECLLESAEIAVMDEMNKKLKDSEYLIDKVMLQTTFDILCTIMADEFENDQGIRYGHPVLDIAREINRYMHPIFDLRYPRKISYKEYCKEDIEENLKSQFLKSVGIPSKQMD